jgi:hypothetical protein
VLSAKGIDTDTLDLDTRERVLESCVIVALNEMYLNILTQTRKTVKEIRWLNWVSQYARNSKASNSLFLLIVKVFRVRLTRKYR